MVYSFLQADLDRQWEKVTHTCKIQTSRQGSNLGVVFLIAKRVCCYFIMAPFKSRKIQRSDWMSLTK